jgi:hypothetical protein
MKEIWNMYLDGTLYSWDTMMFMCICVSLIGFIALYRNMILDDKKHLEKIK